MCGAWWRQGTGNDRSAHLRAAFQRLTGGGSLSSRCSRTGRCRGIACWCVRSSPLPDVRRSALLAHGYRASPAFHAGRAGAVGGEPAQRCPQLGGARAVRAACLVDENRRLREQILTLSHRVQRMASLTAENVRLRELLSATQERDIPFITAELLSLDPDPFTHRMVIDRGRRDGVFVGQPVMDASGWWARSRRYRPIRVGSCWWPMPVMPCPSRSIATGCVSCFRGLVATRASTCFMCRYRRHS